mmetsp:Transcript_16361/g.34244  ORF Transcript_16361/g.34244 Transcript_16361/m.34244 type:complete len:399 (-) Transcript_16361:136-1332(-)
MIFPRDVAFDLANRFDSSCGIADSVHDMGLETMKAVNDSTTYLSPLSSRKKALSMVEMNELSEIVDFSSTLDDLAANVNSNAHPNTCDVKATADDEDDDSGMFLIDNLEDDIGAEFSGDSAEGRTMGGFLDGLPLTTGSIVNYKTSPKPSHLADGDDSNNHDHAVVLNSRMKRSKSVASIPSRLRHNLCLNIHTISEEETSRHTNSQEIENTQVASSSTNDLSNLSTKPLRPSLKRTSSIISHDSSCSSSSSSIQNENNYKDAEPNAFKKSMNRNVSFSSLEIRSYSVTLGNQPTMSGPPISLDWEYDPASTVIYDVDTYESHKHPPRSKQEMLMSASHKYFLLKNMGFTRGEIKAAVEEAKRVQNRRKKTIKRAYLMPVEEALEGAKRKIGKLAGKK